MAVPKTITKGHKIKLTTMDKELDRMEQKLLLPDNEQQTEIAEAITRKTDHTLTILDGHGWYTGKEMKVICRMGKDGTANGQNTHMATRHNYGA